MKEKMGNNSETSENETSDPHIPQPFTKILRQNASFPPNIDFAQELWQGDDSLSTTLTCGGGEDCLFREVC